MTIAVPVGTVTTWTFHADGTEQTLTVPRHDGPIQIICRGGAGGLGGDYPSTGPRGSSGRIQGDGVIAAGTVLTLRPGRWGGAITGTNDGHGGETSTVHIGGTLVLVAGGGGGAGAGLSGGSGGNGGVGLAAGTAGPMHPYYGSSDAGGGTLTGPGVAGTAWIGASASDGAGSTGGAGTPTGPGVLLGGSGGDGYYGGGGGGSGGGGGGGSSWGDTELFTITAPSGTEGSTITVIADVLPWRPRAHLGLVAATR